MIIGNFNKKTENKFRSINKKNLFFKRKFFNAKNLINLSKINLFKKNVKKIEPIYVYEHYAKIFSN